MGGLDFFDNFGGLADLVPFSFIPLALPGVATGMVGEVAGAVVIDVGEAVSVGAGDIVMIEGAGETVSTAVQPSQPQNKGRKEKRSSKVSLCQLGLKHRNSCII